MLIPGRAAITGSGMASNAVLRVAGQGEGLQESASAGLWGGSGLRVLAQQDEVGDEMTTPLWARSRWGREDRVRAVVETHREVGAMRIRDVAAVTSTRKVVTITPDATVRDLVARLAEHNTGALVVSPDEGRP